MNIIRCLDCGYVGEYELKDPFVTSVGCILFIFFFIPFLIYYFRCSANKKRICPQCRCSRLKPLPLEDLEEYINAVKLEKVTTLKEMLHEKIITIEEFDEKLDKAMNELQDIYSVYDEELSYGVLFRPILILIILLVTYISLLYTGIITY